MILKPNLLLPTQNNITQKLFKNLTNPVSNKKIFVILRY